jgi:uncharacterized membrane protein HdeD (DUF308 family)
MDVLRLALLIGVALSLGGLALAWSLRRRAPRIGRIIHLSAAVLVRVLAALAACWSAVQVLDSNNSRHIGAAALLALLALSLVLSAALLVYVLITGRPEPPRRLLRTRKGS